MSNYDWASWDDLADFDEMQNSIKEAEKGGDGNFEDVPHGKYEVSIEKLELVATKKTNKPMLSCWFNIVAGKYKGQKIFMNQVMTEGFQVHLANTFLRSLDTDVDVHFEKYSQYGKLLEEILFKVKQDKLEFALEYGEKKGFNTFKITEVFVI